MNAAMKSRLEAVSEKHQQAWERLTAAYSKLSGQYEELNRNLARFRQTVGELKGNIQQLDDSLASYDKALARIDVSGLNNQAVMLGRRMDDWLTCHGGAGNGVRQAAGQDKAIRAA